MTDSQLNFLLFILFACSIYWLLRNAYYSKLNFEYSLRFERLQDKVRHYAIENKIDGNNWIFDYLDKSLSRTIKRLDSLNLFLSFLMFYRYQRQGDFNSFQVKVQKSLSGNSHANEIFIEYTDLLKSYFRQKHYIFRFFLLTTAQVIRVSAFLITRTKSVFSTNAISDAYNVVQGYKVIPRIYGFLDSSRKSIVFQNDSLAKAS